MTDTLGHGIFTAALLSALRSRRADRNSDGKLALGELLDFLPGRVRDLCRNGNLPEQVIKDIVNVTDTASWTIAASLPIDDTGEARARHILGGKAVAQQGYFEVSSFDPQHRRLQLRAGTLLGLWPGTRVQIHRFTRPAAWTPPPPCSRGERSSLLP